MTFPIKTSDGFDARPVVLVDPTTGEPYIASGGGSGGGSSNTTEATQLLVLGELQSIDSKTPNLALSGRVRTEELGQLGVARQLAAGASSANTALTSTCRRISIHARSGNIRFAIGSSGQTASATSHYIAQGERLDLAVPATPNIAVIRADATDCTLEVTELVEPI